MKNIIAATDFSIASVNACRYAALLATQTGGTLTLFHLFLAPVIHEDKELLKVEHDKSEEKIRKQLSRLIEEFPGLSISYKITSGAFIDQLSELVKSKGNAVLVFGIAPKTWVDKNVYGSHSMELAGKVNTPVIIVPRSYREHRLKKMILGVDSKEDIFNSSLKSVSRWLEKTGVKMQALHVSDKKEKVKLPDAVISVNEEPYRVNIVNARTVESGFRNFVREKNIDLVTILSKSHSVFENIFSESHTRNIAYNSPVPVLALHI